jgi:hypothetical protein
VLDNTNKIKYLSQYAEPVKMVDKEKAGCELFLGLKSLRWLLEKVLGLNKKQCWTRERSNQERD